MKKGKNLSKTIIGIFFVLIIAISSVNVVFAEQDIVQMLHRWMDNKSAQSLNEIENSISQEQREQTTRLKSEIKDAILAAEQQYQVFVENEKIKRINSLKDYADKLIESHSVTVDSGKEITQKLECIASNAEIEMDIVMGTKDKSALKDCGEIVNLVNGVQSDTNSEVTEPEIVEEVKESESSSNNLQDTKTEEDANDTVGSSS